MLPQALCNILKPLVNSKWSYTPETPTAKILQFFCPVRPWNLTDDLEKQ